MKTILTEKGILTLLAILCLSSCRTADVLYQSSYWSTPEAWYQTGETPDAGKVDVFYITSTDVVSSRFPDGTVSYRAVLNEEDRKMMSEEIQFVKKQIFQTDFNYISPFYHQFTFDSLHQSADVFRRNYQKVVREVCDAFDYYMKNRNQGRRFILAGFSQGAMLTLEVLKHMSRKEYEKLVAAYVIGYRISADDLKHRHIQAAKGETDTQVAISFNSVLSTEGIWGAVTDGAVTSINPVNWKTDDTPATLSYRGETGTVTQDLQHRVLIVKLNPEPFHQWMKNPVYQSANVSLDCLHHWDILLYTQHIHDNAVKRAYKNKEK